MTLNYWHQWCLDNGMDDTAASIARFQDALERAMNPEPTAGLDTSKLMPALRFWIEERDKNPGKIVWLRSREFYKTYLESAALVSGFLDFEVTSETGGIGISRVAVIHIPVEDMDYCTEVLLERGYESILVEEVPVETDSVGCQERCTQIRQLSDEQLSEWYSASFGHVPKNLNCLRIEWQAWVWKNDAWNGGIQDCWNAFERSEEALKFIRTDEAPKWDSQDSI